MSLSVLIEHLHQHCRSSLRLPACLLCSPAHLVGQAVLLAAVEGQGKDGAARGRQARLLHPLAVLTLRDGGGNVKHLSCACMEAPCNIWRAAASSGSGGSKW